MQRMTPLLLLFACLFGIMPCQAAPLDDFRECRTLAEDARSKCFAEAIEKAQTQFSFMRFDAQRKRDSFAPSAVSSGMRAKSGEVGAALNLVVGTLAPPGDRGYYDLICLVLLLEYSTQTRFWAEVDTQEPTTGVASLKDSLSALQDMCKKSLDPVVCNQGLEAFSASLNNKRTINNFAAAIGRSPQHVMAVFTHLVAEACQVLVTAIRESNPRMAKQ